MNTMTQLLRSFGDLFLFALLGIPLAVLVWWFLAQWRGDQWRAAGDVAIVAMLLPVVYLVLVPTYGAPSRISMIPGDELTSALAEIQQGSLAYMMQLVANVIMLAPLAAVVPLRIRSIRSLLRIAIAACVLSMSVETAQYLLDSGRISSVDDVLLNTVGATLGAWCTRAWWKDGGRTAHDAPPASPASHQG